jgi:hypothetical protein
MDMHSRRARQQLSGATIYTIAGALWAAYGCYWLHGRVSVVALVAMALAAVGLCFGLVSLNRRLGPEPPGATDGDDGKAFTRVNIGQGIAIFIAVQACLPRHPEALAPAVSVIVGVHFLVLAKIFRNSLHLVLGALMCLLPIPVIAWLPAYLPYGPPPPIVLWGAVPSFANMLLLWIASAWRQRSVAVASAAAAPGH